MNDFNTYRADSQQFIEAQREMYRNKELELEQKIQNMDGYFVSYVENLKQQQQQQIDQLTAEYNKSLEGKTRTEE